MIRTVTTSISVRLDYNDLLMRLFDIEPGQVVTPGNAIQFTYGDKKFWLASDGEIEVTLVTRMESDKDEDEEVDDDDIPF